MGYVSTLMLGDHLKFTTLVSDGFVAHASRPKTHSALLPTYPTVNVLFHSLNYFMHLVQLFHNLITHNKYAIRFTIIYPTKIASVLLL